MAIDWNVKNANSRDVERQHLNKILADIRASVDSLQKKVEAPQSDVRSVVGSMVEGNTERGINVSYNTTKKVLDFVITNFTISLTGDVTGSATVNSLGNVSIATSIDESFGLEEAPEDGLPYWRISGDWQYVGVALESLAAMTGTGFAVIRENNGWVTREFEVVAGELTVINPAGEDGNPTFGLADVVDSNTGTLQGITVDGKGRVTGTTDATITAGAGIDVANGDASAGPPTISHEDTSTVANVSSDNADGVVLQDIAITFDTFGHVQTITVGTVDLDSRYLQPGDEAVQSVNGQTGIVVLDAGDVGADPAGTAAGIVAAGIVNGDTTHAPSGDAVFDALALKAIDANVVHTSGNETAGGIKTWTGTQAIFSPSGASFEQRIDVASTFTGDLTWLRGGVRRWQLRLNNVAESGGNIGSGLDIRGYTDAGAAQLFARWFRNTGVLDFAFTPQVNGTNLAIISSAITNGDTTHSPSGDAVFDALADKGSLTNDNTWTGNQLIESTNTADSPQQIEIENITGSNASGTMLMGTFYSDFSGPADLSLRRAYGTKASPTAVPNGAVLFRLSGAGYDSVDFINGFSIQCIASEAWSTTARGTRFRVRCVPLGSAGAATDVLAADSAHNITPGSDNTQQLGTASLRWKEIFAGNAVINTSDAREKTVRGPLNAAELAASKELRTSAVMFQWNEAIASKGEEARLHCSPTVQSVIAIMKKHGLDPFRYGFVCYDEWEEVQEVINDETGEILQEYKPAGNRYSLRPVELMFFIMAGI